MLMWNANCLGLDNVSYPFQYFVIFIIIIIINFLIPKSFCVAILFFE